MSSATDGTDRRQGILDAAEGRIRATGYNGFSFRDIAGDVGIRSASVHHHFPTKGDLAAAVARRYTDRFLDAVGDAKGPTMVQTFRKVFRGALDDDGRMCLCGMLATEAGLLPPEVAAETRRFFTLALARLTAALAAASPGEPGSEDRAFQVLATLEGAMTVARALGDPNAFDRATGGLPTA